MCKSLRMVCDVCSIHVASVVQMTHMLLCHGGIMQSKALGKIQLMSAYWSAAVHDFEHGGVNNDFLIKTAHPLSITYNDQSPLENHHLAAAVRLIFDPELAFMPVSCYIILQASHSIGLTEGLQKLVCCYRLKLSHESFLGTLSCTHSHCGPVADDCMFTFSHAVCQSMLCLRFAATDFSAC